MHWAKILCKCLKRQPEMPKRRRERERAREREHLCGGLALQGQCGAHVLGACTLTAAQRLVGEHHIALLVLLRCIAAGWEGEGGTEEGGDRGGKCTIYYDTMVAYVCMHVYIHVVYTETVKTLIVL